MKPSGEEQGCISLVPLMYAIYKTVGGWCRCSRGGRETTQN